jgi:hypothetical protein
MAINYHTITSISATFRCFRRLRRRSPPASVATSLSGSPLPMPTCFCPWPCCLPLLPPPLPPPADTGPARYRRPRPKRGSDAVVGDREWTIPLPTSADTSIEAMATKGTMSCSLASDLFHSHPFVAGKGRIAVGAAPFELLGGTESRSRRHCAARPL